ncbi:MAG: cell division ATP-binding protein FtsE [Polyangia bacterium]
MMIRLDGVWKSFAGAVALRGVSMEVAAGDALLLTGPSGAGKTTLMRLLFAAERADRGEVQVAGRSLKRLRASSIPYVRRNIGVVFQDFKLLEDRSAVENVAVALEILELPRREVLKRAQAALEAVGLATRARTLASSLSGGEQQRVAVARAIAGEPSLLLCDEPTGNLDPERAHELLELLEGIHRRGTTLLVATHDPEVVDFGVEAGWRRARLCDGELLDVELPGDRFVGRPARLDEETEGFSTRRDYDAPLVFRLRTSAHPALEADDGPRLKVVP